MVKGLGTVYWAPYGLWDIGRFKRLKVIGEKKKNTKGLLPHFSPLVLISFVSS